jgi:NADH:ubiquinone oxidoreductase subunit F (NADH-binding)/(2Fe-2S) ferredoxin/NAD-dependent dihydropyrimidine dehydrogenase PreA subunit
MAAFKSARQLLDYRKKLKSTTSARRRTIAVCAGTGCKALGSFSLFDAFTSELKKNKLTSHIDLVATGCHGFCERGPLVLFHPEGVLYQRVKHGDVAEIVSKTVKDGKIITRLLYKDPNNGKQYRKEQQIPFYKHQKRMVLASNGHLDPTSIDDYIRGGGYSALAKAVEMGSRKIISEIKRSGLRGRGGAGFPTGTKWEICSRTESDKRYLICNADEGDPGAFMDRSVLEGNPHSVIEGMIIGALAIGADEGYVYVRQEYPLAVERLEIALKQARRLGLLGKNILGSKARFDVKINRGGGAFVCGEESALIASIQGARGVPRRRPPYPAVEGLFGKPTNINNVETWANVPLIIDKGSKWYAEIGTAGSKGTKIFSLVGKVNNTGLVEVPMGMTMRKIVFDIGGGIPGGKKFKAVQTGGPSGGCLPESKLDTPVDFDTLLEQGAMMGSGGMIVMDESTCMVDVARYFLRFLKSESCGNCTSCREGLVRLHELLTDICEGRANADTIPMILELAETVKTTSLCALGKTAVNPVLSTLRYFGPEYRAHIEQGRCPAGVCKALITYSIDAKLCNGCTLCLKNCPEGAVSGQKKKLHVIDQDKCIKCGICKDVCNQDAVLVE